MPETVVWGQGQEAAFVEYLYRDMNRALTDRSALERRWGKWLEQYRAPVTGEVKNFPWVNASNITLPFTAMNADPLIAKFVTTLTTPPNIWSLQPLNERWLNAAKPMQDFLQFLSQGPLHMYDVLYRFALEFVKLGTGIFKHGWTFERRSKLMYGIDGKIIRGQEMLSQPFVDHVSLVDFLLPPEALHIQADQQGGAAWVAERFWLRRAQFLARAKGQAPFAPDYDPEGVDLVAKFVDSSNSTQGTVEDVRWRLDDNVPSYLRRIELWEVHCRFDTQGDGSVDDVVAVFHLPSRTVLRTILNPYRHGKRPYEEACYFRGDGFYGIGECEQSEVFQTILSTLSNYQIDNVLAVNAPMLGVKLGANVVADEPIYPLKIWPLEDPSKDIREVKFTDMYQSLPQLSSIFKDWGERRTGLNDLNASGNIQSLPSRTPATSILSMLSEGNKRFDLSLKDIRFALDRVGLRLIQNIQQFLSSPQENPAAGHQLQMMVMALGQPEGGYVAQQLLMPIEDIETGLGVSVTATSSSVNKEVEKQSFLALLQLQSQMFAPLYLQLAQILGNPQIQMLEPIVVQTAGQLFVATTELQKRLYEQYDQRNIEQLVPDAALLMDAAARYAPVAQALTLAAGRASAEQSARTEKPRNPESPGTPAKPGLGDVLLAVGAAGGGAGNGTG